MATVLLSVGGFFLGNYSSDISDVDLFIDFSKSAKQFTNLPETHSTFGFSMILSQAYKKEADMWQDAVSMKKRDARKNACLGIGCWTLGLIFLILSLYT